VQEHYAPLYMVERIVYEWMMSRIYGWMISRTYESTHAPTTAQRLSGREIEAHALVMPELGTEMRGSRSYRVDIQLPTSILDGRWSP
jgi:hypothetical protein